MSLDLAASSLSTGEPLALAPEASRSTERLRDRTPGDGSAPPDRSGAPLSPTLQTYRDALDLVFGEGARDAYCQLCVVESMAGRGAAGQLLAAGAFPEAQAPGLARQLGEALQVAPDADRVLRGDLDPTRIARTDRDIAIAITFPEQQIRLFRGVNPSFGHAGVLLVDDETGRATYYEFGRYDDGNRGVVRRLSIPGGVDIAPNSDLSPETIQTVLGQIADLTRDDGTQHDRISAAYVPITDYDSVRASLEDLRAQNDDPDRRPYAVLGYNCMTFVYDALEQGGAALYPERHRSVAPNPGMDQLQQWYVNVEYDDRTGRLDVTGPRG